MTVIEFEELVDWIEARWPSSKAFQRWETLAGDFYQVPKAAAEIVLQEHYDEGNKYPLSVSQLKKQASHIAYAKQMIDPELSECSVRGFHGVFAVQTEDTYYGMVPHNGGLGKLPPGFAEGTCVVCGVTVRKPAEDLLGGPKKEELTW